MHSQDSFSIEMIKSRFEINGLDPTKKIGELTLPERWARVLRYWKKKKAQNENKKG